MYPMWWSKNLATRSSAALAGKARLLHRRVERREPRFARIRAPPGPALRHGVRGSARTLSRFAGEDGVARLRRRKALSGGERTCGPAEGSNDLNVTREAALVAYRAFSDVAGKGAFFLVTVLAARRLSQAGFGIFSLGTTFGWMAAVATDFGIQLHLARAVARRPDEAARLLRSWLRVRVWTSVIALAAVSAGVALTGAGGSSALAVLLFVLVYIVSGLIEFLHYFYRGLSRSDVESTLTLWQRFGTLGCAAIALAWRPEVTTLAVAMLLPVAVTLGYSIRRAARLAPQPAALPGPPAMRSGMGR